MDYPGRSSATVEDVDSNNTRSIGDILRDIASSIQTIVRSEIRLAKIEVTDSARRARSASVALAVGGLFGVYAIAFILLAVMFALELVLPAWLSALIVGVLMLIGAGIGLGAGRARLKTVRPPAMTIQTVKEDLQWTNEQARS